MKVYHSGLREEEEQEEEVTCLAERLIKSENDLAALGSPLDNQRYHLTTLLGIDKNFPRSLFRAAD